MTNKKDKKELKFDFKNSSNNESIGSAIVNIDECIKNSRKWVIND